jgi:hypothetical protein
MQALGVKIGEFWQQVFITTTKLATSAWIISDKEGKCTANNNHLVTEAPHMGF